MIHTAQMIKGQLWVHFEGRTFLFENPKEKKFGKKSSSQKNPGELTSPMPGKITKLFKKLGDPVEAGEPVLVMEAMKMEYTLKANLSGSITELFCQAGDQVQLGKTLAKIETKK